MSLKTVIIYFKCFVFIFLSYTCNIYGKDIVSKLGRSRHVRFVHTNHQLGCGECTKTCRSKVSLRRHERKVHQMLSTYTFLQRSRKTLPSIKTSLHETEKRKRASYERKKEKAKRRITVLERMEISAVKKAKIRPALENKYMSSEEECADGFVTHQPSWQSEKFAEYKRKLDSKFLDICSTKSRRLLSKRTIGSASEKETPDIKDETHGL